jgi:hypothetical protein
MDFAADLRAWMVMEFDDDPASGSIWHIVILVVIAVLMNALAVFLFARAFPPQRHDVSAMGRSAGPLPSPQAEHLLTSQKVTMAPWPC